ncbi:hypothetical protein ACH4MO_22685 [Streptomyces globisporus]|uniref:hypothetical protein n=1 Tax=Streptomyces globisporus TaxID=1908 RepID=UPI0036D1875F
MDILDWLLWPALAVALLEAFGAIRGIRRLREAAPRSPDHGTSGPRRVRTLLDNVASLFIVTGLLPGMKAGEPWLRRLQAP